MTGTKILITGANGMLGSNLLKDLSNYETVGCTSKQLDITDREEVALVLEKEVPDCIIHTAAFTNVELCETEADQAYHINTIGTQNLVNYCIGKEVLFIYISSTGIYGTGQNMPYSEFDKVCPTTVHHHSKLEAEKIVQNHLHRYLILRTGWLYGGDITHQKNFIYKRYLEAKESDKIHSDDSQIGNPTYIKNLVKQIELLISSKQYGLYNCVDHAENISRYDYVKKIIELFELTCKVEVAPAGMFKRIAPVSQNESALNYKLNLQKLNVMKNWDDSLREYVELLREEL